MPINIFNCLQEMSKCKNLFLLHQKFSVYKPIKVFIIFNDIVAFFAYYEYLRTKNPSN